MNISPTYTQEQYKKFLGIFISAVKRDDLQEAKEVLSHHREKLRTITQPENEFDIVNDTQLWGWSALHISVYFGHDKMYMWLTSEGGKADVRTQDGWNCLALAAQQGNVTIVTLLVGSQHIDVNQMSPKGTALHLAAQQDYLQVLVVLLTHPKLNFFLLNQKDQTALDIAGKKAKPILMEEIQKHNRQYSVAQDKLLKTFRSSVSNFIRLTQLSQNSFLANMPNRPPLIKGCAKKPGMFKMLTYDRYFVVDPESGVLARFKCEQDYPLNPCELISLESIDDIYPENDKWFQKDDLYYLKIVYRGNQTYLAFQYEQTMKQWVELLKQCVGYVKFVQGKLSNYFQTEQEDKAHKRVIQAMIDLGNKEIVILDDNQYTFAQVDTNYKVPSFQRTVPQEKVLEKVHLIDVPKVSEIQCDGKIGIRHFDFISLLGKGSFGNVYKVRCKINCRIYALKQQEKEKLGKAGHVKYAKGELSVLRKVSNPFLVNLHCSFQTPKYLYLVLDLCSKGDLSNYITRGVVLDEMTAKFFAAEILLAIVHLHSKNILYRDLKPENISLDEQGHVKLIDFGLSRHGHHQDFVAMSFCGSPAYLSPELIRGEGATRATDVYTLGTVLYEMLTGYPPHYCGKLDQLFHDIRYKPIKVPNNLSKAAQDLLNKMLDKTPTHRITTEEMVQHMFFAEINWYKLVAKQCIPPKLVQRFGLKAAAQTASTSNLLDLQLDSDYEDGKKDNYVADWDFQ